MHWPVHPLKDILDTENDALVQRILELALAHGFTDQTSSMRAPGTKRPNGSATACCST